MLYARGSVHAMKPRFLFPRSSVVEHSVSNRGVAAAQSGEVGSIPAVGASFEVQP